MSRGHSKAFLRTAERTLNVWRGALVPSRGSIRLESLRRERSGWQAPRGQHPRSTEPANARFRPARGRACEVLNAIRVVPRVSRLAAPPNARFAGARPRPRRAKSARSPMAILFDRCERSLAPWVCDSLGYLRFSSRSPRGGREMGRSARRAARLCRTPRQSRLNGHSPSGSGRVCRNPGLSWPPVPGSDRLGGCGLSDFCVGRFLRDLARVVYRAIEVTAFGDRFELAALVALGPWGLRPPPPAGYVWSER